MKKAQATCHKILCFLVSLFVVLFVAVTGCTPGQIGNNGELQNGSGGSGKNDAWNFYNDPSRLPESLEYNFNILRKLEYRRAEVKNIPWPDTYWPAQKDGYNYRWQGSEKMSPMELYDLAFNGWSPPDNFMSLRPFTYPGNEFDPAYYDALGPAAKWAHENGGNYPAVNSGGQDWGGLEGWFGHCHAWAPSSLSIPEPQHAVTENGVTFEVGDIKALIETTFEINNLWDDFIVDAPSSKMLGDRCYLEDVIRDEHGRITEDSCRDTNAGTFHVVLINFVGMLGRSFVMDMSYGQQVWNHPIRGYRIQHEYKIPESRALELLQRQDVDKYPYNDNAVEFAYIKMELKYVVEGSASVTPYLANIDSYTRTDEYEYILELDADENIIGGEWINPSHNPDFMFIPQGNGSVLTKSGRVPIIDVDNVMRLAQKSVE